MVSHSQTADGRRFREFLWIFPISQSINQAIYDNICDFYQILDGQKGRLSIQTNSPIQHVHMNFRVKNPKIPKMSKQIA